MFATLLGIVKRELTERAVQTADRDRKPLVDMQKVKRVQAF